MGIYDKLGDWEIDPVDMDDLDNYVCTYGEAQEGNCRRSPAWPVKRKGHPYTGDALCNEHGGTALAHIAEWTMGRVAESDPD